MEYNIIQVISSRSEPVLDEVFSVMLEFAQLVYNTVVIRFDLVLPVCWNRSWWKLNSFYIQSVSHFEITSFGKGRNLSICAVHCCFDPDKIRFAEFFRNMLPVFHKVADILSCQYQWIFLHTWLFGGSTGCQKQYAYINSSFHTFHINCRIQSAFARKNSAMLI